jgi:CheY-like chemotaxis protein
MIEQLNCIMLIDDDEDDNFFHRIVVEESGFARSIKISDTAVDALEWFQSVDRLPELLFLDLNLPKINGWEFVEALEKMNLSTRPVIIMLTTSFSPFDKQKALEFKINGFETKPLDKEKLHAILKKFF